MRHSVRDHIISAAITVSAVGGWMLLPGSARSAARLLSIDVPPPALIGVSAPGALASAMATADTAALGEIPVDIVKGDSVQVFAAFLYVDTDTVIGCTGWDFTKPETVEPCNRAADLLMAAFPEYFPQDTINRITRFRWPRQAVATSYNIVVIQPWDLLAVLDTLVLDTALVWTAGIVDSTYWVKGAARFLGTQAAFGDSTVFGFPSPVVLLPVQPIVVDTLP